MNIFIHFLQIHAPLLTFTTSTTTITISNDEDFNRGHRHPINRRRWTTRNKFIVMHFVSWCCCCRGFCTRWRRMLTTLSYRRQELWILQLIKSFIKVAAAADRMDVSSPQSFDGFLVCFAFLCALFWNDCHFLRDTVKLWMQLWYYRAIQQSTYIDPATL